MIANIQAVGMIEFNSIAAGIEASDFMIKASLVEPLMMKTICPGKFVSAVFSDVAAVQASIAAGLKACPDTIVDHFVIPNIHPDVISAMAAAMEPGDGPALGVIETFSAASSIVAADAAVKAANINLIEVRIAMGLGGKAFCTFNGDVSSVKAAAEAGAAQVEATGLLVRKVVIPSISPEVMQRIM